MPPFLTSTVGSVPEGKERITLITEKLNEIVDTAMKTQCSHIAFVDADIEIPPHTFQSLLELDVDIASGVYPFKDNPDRVYPGILQASHKSKTGWRWTPFKRGEIQGRVTNHQRVASGNGCLLVKRRVFEPIHPQYEPLRFRTGYELSGGDIQFFIDAQNLGFKASIDGRVWCGHLPDCPLEEGS